MFKRLANSIKEVTVIILILGFLKQLVYYSNFHIPIKYFLGISDLWLFISDDLIYTAPFSFMLVVVYDLIRNDKSPDIALEPENLKKEKRFFRFLKIVIGIIFSFSLFYFFYTNEYPTKVQMALVWVFCIVAFFLISFPYDKRLSLKNETIFIFFGLGFITFLLVYKTTIDIGKVNYNLYKGTIVKTVDSSYVSTDSSYFIGKTESYVFIYNKQDSTTAIIPTDQIKEIIMKSKH